MHSTAKNRYLSVGLLTQSSLHTKSSWLIAALRGRKVDNGIPEVRCHTEDRGRSPQHQGFVFTTLASLVFVACNGNQSNAGAGGSIGGAGGLGGTGNRSGSGSGGHGTGGQGGTDTQAGGGGAGGGPRGGATGQGGSGGPTGGQGGISAQGGGGVAGSSGAGGITGQGGIGGRTQTGTGGQPGSGSTTGAGGAATGPRVIQNFNQSRKFKRADVTGAEATTFDDSSWGNIGLPHSFGLPYFAPTKFYVGYGWYRKHFTVPSSWSGKRVFLEFQAAFDQAQIYLNGKQVGQHIGGYNGFSIDISSAMTTGDNVVAVRLNNNWNAQLPPQTGDHTFQGGIYRDVNVVITDPLHVTWYGTWVTTTTLATNSGSSSTVEIKTEVQNSRSAAVNATLKTDIVDNTGKVVTTISTLQQIAAGATVTFDQTTPAVSSPSLWHPDHPTICTRRFLIFPTARGPWTPSPRRSGSAGSAGRGRRASR